MEKNKEFSKRILDSINRVRADPPAFAKELEDNELPHIDEEGVISLPSRDPMMLEEGKQAVSGSHRNDSNFTVVSRLHQKSEITQKRLSRAFAVE